MTEVARVALGGFGALDSEAHLAWLGFPEAARLWARW